MDAFIFKTQAPAPGEPPAYDESCERMWELFSTFLTEQIFYAAYDSAMGYHAQNKSVSIADHYLSLLSASCQRLARDRELVARLARTFFDYAKSSQPALKHDSEPVFLSRVVQAYAPATYVRDMGPDQIRQYTQGALVTIALRAYEIARGADVSDRILRREAAVVDSLRGQFNQLSRAHRLELGAQLSQRGKVTVKTPYDDASEHIRLLTAQIQNLQTQVGRLTQDNQTLREGISREKLRAKTWGERASEQGRRQASSVATLTAENSRIKRELARHSKANTELLRCAASQISAREKLARENNQHLEDARTLLNIQRLTDKAAHEAGLANQLPLDYEPTADDSVSVRGSRPLGYAARRSPSGGSGSSASGSESDQSGEVDLQSIMQSFDSKSKGSTQFERDLE